MNKKVHEICMNCKHVVVDTSDKGTSNYICTLNENITDAESICNRFKYNKEDELYETDESDRNIAK